jgi:hypothetical protein
MKRLVRKAIATDLPVVLKLIESGRKIMRESGNPNQWGKNHPSTAQLQKDIEDGHSYLLMDRDKAIATFMKQKRRCCQHHTDHTGIGGLY